MAKENPYYTDPYKDPVQNPLIDPYADLHKNPYDPTNPYANPYANPYVNPYSNPYQNPYMSVPGAQGGMLEEEESKSSFNLLEWLIRVVHYWYLFVIAAALAYGVAALINRKWIEEYESSGTILIKESGSQYASQRGLFQGFGLEPVYNNINNQLVMLGSYDLLGRVVDSIPFLQVDYYTQGRFKTRTLYRSTPVIIEPDYIQESVKGLLFQITFKGDGVMHIHSTDEKRPYESDVHYGERVETPYFVATFWPSEYISQSGQIYFRFRTRDGLINEFQSRMRHDFVMDGSSVLRLTLRSQTPQRDCDFINKLAEVYLAQNLEKKNEVANKSTRLAGKE